MTRGRPRQEEAPQLPGEIMDVMYGWGSCGGMLWEASQLSHALQVRAESPHIAERSQQLAEGGARRCQQHC